MRTDTKTICGEPAIIQYAWANELKRACVEHANQMAILGQVMGAPIQAQIVPTDELCQHQVEPAPSPQPEDGDK